MIDGIKHHKAVAMFKQFLFVAAFAEDAAVTIYGRANIEEQLVSVSGSVDLWPAVPRLFRLRISFSPLTNSPGNLR